MGRWEGQDSVLSCTAPATPFPTATHGLDPRPQDEPDVRSAHHAPSPPATGSARAAAGSDQCGRWTQESASLQTAGEGHLPQVLGRGQGPLIHAALGLPLRAPEPRAAGVRGGRLSACCLHPGGEGRRSTQAGVLQARAEAGNAHRGLLDCAERGQSARSQERGRAFSWAPPGDGPAPWRGAPCRLRPSRVGLEAWGWVTELDLSQESDTRVQRIPASRPGQSSWSWALGRSIGSLTHGRLGAGGSAWAQGHPAVLS